MQPTNLPEIGGEMIYRRRIYAPSERVRKPLSSPQEVDELVRANEEERITPTNYRQIVVGR